MKNGGLKMQLSKVVKPESRNRFIGTGVSFKV
jgi:hypothetical protein